MYRRAAPKGAGHAALKILGFVTLFNASKHKI